MMLSPTRGLFVALALAASAPCIAQSQDFPAKSIRFVVPYPPGGSGDFVGRLYAEHMAKAIDRTVVVDNRPGAATNIAGDLVARADADGYTLLMGTSQSIINKVFGPTPAFDAVTGFAPVAMLAHLPFMIAANPGTAIASVKDLVAAARDDQLSLAHAQFEAQIKLLSLATGVKVVGIPYKGGAQALTDTLSGQTKTVLALVPVLMTQVKAGKLRAVGVAASSRIGAVPDVPTFAEQGYPKFTTSFWMSVVAPKGTPEAVLRRLTASTLEVTKDAQYAVRLRAAGAEPVVAGAEETAARMREEHEIWIGASKVGG